MIAKQIFPCFPTLSYQIHIIENFFLSNFSYGFLSYHEFFLSFSYRSATSLVKPTFLATPPSPRFGWVRSWDRCRCASIGVDHPPLSSRPDAGAPASASLTPPYHQGPMRARQHRCSILVFLVLSWCSCGTL